MNLREEDNKLTLEIDQLDLDNAMPITELNYEVKIENIRGGIGHSIFENDYITNSKYMMGSLSLSNSIRNLIHELELAKQATKINVIQIKAYDYCHTSTEDILKGIADIDSYIKDRDTQIISIKSQLKYCKNPLQKLNLEREMNRLIRERNRK